MNIGGQKLKDKKEAAAGAKAKVEKLSKEVQQKQINAEKALKDAAKAEEAIKKAEESLDQTTKTILVMEKERQEIDQQAADPKSVLTRLPRPFWSWRRSARKSTNRR